jgi:hypothetical protein
MALGDLNHIESAFAEATLDPALWGRALDTVAPRDRKFRSHSSLSRLSRGRSDPSCSSH